MSSPTTTTVDSFGRRLLDLEYELSLCNVTALILDSLNASSVEVTDVEHREILIDTSSNQFCENEVDCENPSEYQCSLQPPETSSASFILSYTTHSIDAFLSCITIGTSLDAEVVFPLVVVAFAYNTELEAAEVEFSFQQLGNLKQVAVIDQAWQGNPGTFTVVTHWHAFDTEGMTTDI